MTFEKGTNETCCRFLAYVAREFIGRGRMEIYTRRTALLPVWIEIQLSH
jgi:hypothetical protein